MKQKISYLLVLCMLFSLCSGFSVVANAADHSNGTQVSYTAPNETAYTVTVPAEMNPGDEGTVSVAGKWNSASTLIVSADTNVILTNSLDETQAKSLDVIFTTMRVQGSNTHEITHSATIAVEEMSGVLFGTWSGQFYYNVEMQYDEPTHAPVELNEYGFVYNQPYEATVNVDGQDVEAAFVFYEDKSSIVWSSITTERGTWEPTNQERQIALNAGLLTFSEDGRTVTDGHDVFALTPITLADTPTSGIYKSSYIMVDDMGASHEFTLDVEIGVKGDLYMGSQLLDTMPLAGMTYVNGCLILGEQIVGYYYPDGSMICIPTIDIPDNTFTKLSDEPTQKPEHALNEYGFYYAQPYSVYTPVNNLAQEASQQNTIDKVTSVVFYEDGSGILWYTDFFAIECPAGHFKYSDGVITESTGSIITVAPDGNSIQMGGKTMTASLVQSSIPTAGVYVAARVSSEGDAISTIIAEDGSMTGSWVVNGNFNQFEFTNGRILSNGDTVGYYYPDGTKIAWKDAATEGNIVLHKCADSSYIESGRDQSHNLLFNHLYVKADTENEGFVFYENGIVGYFTYTNMTEAGPMTEMMGKECAGWYVSADVIFDEAMFTSGDIVDFTYNSQTYILHPDEVKVFTNNSVYKSEIVNASEHIVLDCTIVSTSEIAGTSTRNVLDENGNVISVEVEEYIFKDGLLTINTPLTGAFTVEPECIVMPHAIILSVPEIDTTLIVAFSIDSTRVVFQDMVMHLV